MTRHRWGEKFVACRHCGAEFNNDCHRQKFCSNDCARQSRLDASSRRRRDLYKANPAYREKKCEAAKLYRAANREAINEKRRNGDRPCKSCGALFSGYGLRITCSLKCKKEIGKKTKAAYRAKATVKARARERDRKRAHEPLRRASVRKANRKREQKLELAWKIVRELAKNDERLQSIIGELNDIA